jgi:hypothetical protein
LLDTPAAIQGVADELARAWPYFDLEQYARDVLSNSILLHLGIGLSEPDLVGAMRYFGQCPRLEFVINSGLSQEEVYSAEDLYSEEAMRALATLTDHPGLRQLSLRNCVPSLSLASLAGIPNLVEIYLQWSSSWPPDLTPIARIKGLQKVTLAGDMTLEELRSVRLSASLHCIVLVDVASMIDLAELPTPPSSVRRLELRSCAQLQSLNGIAQWPDLEEVVISDCGALVDVEALRHLEVLGRLIMDESAAQLVANLGIELVVEAMPVSQ